MLLSGQLEDGVLMAQLPLALNFVPKLLDELLQLLALLRLMDALVDGGCVCFCLSGCGTGFRDGGPGRRGILQCRDFIGWDGGCRRIILALVIRRCGIRLCCCFGCAGSGGCRIACLHGGNSAAWLGIGATTLWGLGFRSNGVGIPVRGIIYYWTHGSASQF